MLHEVVPSPEHCVDPDQDDAVHGLVKGKHDNVDNVREIRGKPSFASRAEGLHCGVEVSVRGEIVHSVGVRAGERQREEEQPAQTDETKTVRGMLEELSNVRWDVPQRKVEEP